MQIYLNKRLVFTSVMMFVLSIVLIGCSSKSDQVSDPSTTTTTIPLVGDPVVDFKNLADNYKAVDRSFLSVDKAGVYGVIVTKRFEFLQYTTTGWNDKTSSIEGLTNELDTQIIDGRKVESAMSVTTRDYTRDRENDFLIQFGSNFAKFGAIASLRDGNFELKPFCQTNPSTERPGVIRVFTIENLSFNDAYRIIEGFDYDSAGGGSRDYWKWSRNHGCFKTTSSLR